MEVELYHYHEDFIKACMDGEVELVKKFLAKPNLDPTYDQTVAFTSAVYMSRYDVVKLLLNDSRIDPRVRNNRALQMACNEIDKDHKMIEILMADSRVAELYNKDKDRIPYNIN